LGLGEGEGLVEPTTQNMGENREQEKEKGEKMGERHMKTPEQNY